MEKETLNQLKKKLAKKQQNELITKDKNNEDTRFCDKVRQDRLAGQK
jgi:hypothetical protein